MDCLGLEGRPGTGTGALSQLWRELGENLQHLFVSPSPHPKVPLRTQHSTPFHAQKRGAGVTFSPKIHA